MDRRIVAGIVGIILAGWAQASPAQTGPDPSGLPPVGLTPLRSITDSINNTTVDPRRVEIPSQAVPTNPTASGPPAAIPLAPTAPGPVSLTPEPPLNHSLRSGYPSGRPSRLFRANRPLAGLSATQAATIAPRPVAPPARPGPTRSAAATAPATAPAPAPAPMADPSTLAGLPPAEAEAPAPIPAGRPAPFAGQVPEVPRPQSEASTSTSAGRPAPMSGEQPRVARPQAPADDRPPAPRPRASAPNPPSYRPVEAPAPAPPPGPSPGPPPIEVGPGTDLSLPPPPTIGDPPPLGPNPLGAEASPEPVPAPEVKPAPVAPPPAPDPTPPADPEVKRVSMDATAIKMKPTRPRPRELPFATRRAAAVGDEVITFDELREAIAPRLAELKGAGPMSEQEIRQATNLIAARALDGMIDQSVIIQEAKRRMRNPKAQTMFNEFVDKTWRDDELPPLLRKTATANEYELKRKLAEQGTSYEAMKEAFRKKLLARDFLGAEIRNKVTSDLAEQRAFYNEHLKSFDQPARLSWREIEVRVDKHPSRAAARQKADEILARLLRNEDFDALARAISDGPTASKGGLYPDMSPGGYGIPVVNDELNRLPVGQVSTILEAPTSFHIVRVDSRREAGPLRFDEVQDKVKLAVLEKNHQKAVEDYLNKLRSRTLIRTMFDKTDSDPNTVRRKDPAVQPVSNR